MGPNARGALVALAAFGLYATHDAVVKILGGIYSPVQTIFFSTMFSFPLAMIMIMRDRAPGTLRPVHPGWIAVRTVAGVVTALTAFYAFSVLPLAQVYTIIFATPLIITILSIPILGERVRLRRWAAVIVGLMGVLVVLRPGSTELELGHAAALVAAVGGSLAAIIVRKVGADERPVVLMLYPMVANFVVMGAALGFVYEPMPVQHVGALALMAGLGWIGGLCIIAAYKTGEAVVVAPMQYSQIIWATIYGYLLFSEGVETNTLVGAAIIIASGIYIVARESRAGGDSNRPVLRSKARVETGNFPKPPRLPEGRARLSLRGLAGRSAMR
ncbi:DMT family transporter [Wenxinia marina]|uniref:Permease of the drug/metabolite transporter (DMT) superfamily n=1 Tax=Wenxinia marina DSM 24838 TaxID=1123501 RepID=A0A0D0QF21_9RHOB|nr:DMT family transporter [Wenxinia marina]KIQ70927.1 Permease of the drug/metabolite transporter (DMT) superfamily [Wenxinia marina DSM 24838]GGL56252.1 membrane protein [Wenxinia marina]